MSENRSVEYRTGDVVNGHQLTADGQWIPVSAAPPAEALSADSAKPKRPFYKKKRVIIPALLLVAVVGVNAVSSDGDSGSGSGTVATQEADATVGTTVSDGDFEFMVEGVESMGTQVGDDIFGETADGEYVAVTVTVTNTGDSPATWFEDNQVLIIDGKEYAADSMATLVVNDEGWINEINPGNSATLTLVYDVPEGSTPDAIELHDSAFSGGVTVKL